MIVTINPTVIVVMCTNLAFERGHFKWRFPKIGVPLNHPFIAGSFHYKHKYKPSSYWGIRVPPLLWNASNILYVSLDKNTRSNCEVFDPLIGFGEVLDSRQLKVGIAKLRMADL